jgi:hypothetical protein
MKKLPTSKSSQTTTEVALTALVCLAQQSKPTVPALLYAHLAMCEYTLIQSTYFDFSVSA